MPEICRFFGIVITINYRELPHFRPHFHARYGGSRASVAIDTLEVLAGSLSPRALGLVLEWARQHQAELAENWNRRPAANGRARSSPSNNEAAMKDLLRDVTEVRPVGGYRLYLCFDDGASGVVDLEGLLRPFDGVFEPLRDPSYFRQVRVNPDLGTICWPNDADIAPETLYALVTGSDAVGTGRRKTLLLTPDP